VLWFASFLANETVSQNGGGNDEESSGLVAIVKKRLKPDAARHTRLQMSSLTLFERSHLQQAMVDRNH
jgi:hypothetical protein